MNDPTNPELGEVHIDATGIKNRVDLPNEIIGKLSKVRDGYKKAIACLSRIDAAALKRLGILPEDVEAAVEQMKDREEALKFVAPFEKAAEIMRETAADNAHKIAGFLSQAAKQARSRAERDPQLREVIGQLDELFDYQYGPAEKGQLTRAKARAEEEQKAEAVAPAQPLVA